MVSMQDLSEGKKDNLPLKIFLWALAGFVIIMIVTWGWGAFSSGRDYTDEATQPALDCLGIVFSLKDISLDGERTTVTVVNEQYSDHPIPAFVFTSGMNRKKVNFTLFEPGMERTVTLEGFEVANGSITAYPDTCFPYRKEYVQDPETGIFTFKKKIGLQ